MLSEQLDVVSPPRCQLLKLPATHLGMHKSSTTEPGVGSALSLQEEPSLSAPSHLAFSLNRRDSVMQMAAASNSGMILLLWEGLS